MYIMQASQFSSYFPMTSSFKTKTLTVLGVAACAVFVQTALHQPVQAAPKAAPKASKTTTKTLTFQMTARFSYQDGSDATAAAQQVMDANFFVSGDRVRIESEVAGRPMVVLYAPPYAYRLSPSAKTGIRYQAAALPDITARYFGSRDFLPNPASVRSSLQKAGAKKTGSSRINGQPVDVYEVKNLRGQKNHAKAWLRKSDALPLRFELTSPKLRGVASWRNYQRGRALSSTLFQVPSNYRIIDRTRSSR
jgi:hypothetical protein